MSRISIDVTPEEHHRLKVLATREKKSIKQFVLDRTLGRAEGSGDDEVAELLAILDQRIERGLTSEVSARTVDDVFASVCTRKGVTRDDPL